MSTLISATDMIRSFSDIVGRVYYRGEVFDIKKGGNIVARLSPVKTNGTIAVSDLNEFFRNAPHLEEDDIEKIATDISELNLLPQQDGGNKWD